MVVVVAAMRVSRRRVYMVVGAFNGWSADDSIWGCGGKR